MCAVGVRHFFLASHFFVSPQPLHLLNPLLFYSISPLTPLPFRPLCLLPGPTRLPQKGFRDDPAVQRRWSGVRALHQALGYLEGLQERRLLPWWQGEEGAVVRVWAGCLG